MSPTQKACSSFSASCTPSVAAAARQSNRRRSFKSASRRLSMSSPNIQEVVKEKYGQAALRVVTGGGSSCCGAAPGSASCGDPITSNLYDESQKGQLPETAVLASLGCGNPTALAELIPGETVLDLGSGGGRSEERRVGKECRSRWS